MYQLWKISGFSSVFNGTFFFENLTKNRNTYRLGYQLGYEYCITFGKTLIFFGKKCDFFLFFKNNKFSKLLCFE